MSTPIRTCIGCRATDTQDQLMRWVVSAEDPTRVMADTARRISGRGAWLHPRPECAEQAVKRRAFARAFKTSGITHDANSLLLAIDALATRASAHTETETESGSGKVETR